MSLHGSSSSIRSRKEGTLLKIGEFLQSSPTLFSSKGQSLGEKTDFISFIQPQEINDDNITVVFNKTEMAVK